MHGGYEGCVTDGKCYPVSLDEFTFLASLFADDVEKMEFNEAYEYYQSF